MRGVIRGLAERSRLVSAFKASGLSAQAFARREGLPPAPAVHIARVIASGHTASGGGRSIASVPALMVELGAARVHVSTGCDPRTLATVFEAIGAGRKKDAP